MAKNDKFEVKLTDTAHTARNGHDLGVWRYGHGWITSDLNVGELREIRDGITKYLDDLADADNAASDQE